VVVYGSGALKVELVHVLQLVDDRLRVLGTYDQIINVDTDEFIVIVNPLHPYVRLRFTHKESESVKYVSHHGIHEF
jgi:hypothetical protein